VEIVAGLDTPQVVFFVVLALVFVLLLRSGFATWLRCSSSSRWAPRGRSAGGWAIFLDRADRALSAARSVV